MASLQKCRQKHVFSSCRMEPSVVSLNPPSVLGSSGSLLPTADSRAVDRRPPRCTLRKGKEEGPGGGLAHHTEKLLSLPKGLVVSAIRSLIPWPVWAA